AGDDVGHRLRPDTRILHDAADMARVPGDDRRQSEQDAADDERRPIGAALRFADELRIAHETRPMSLRMASVLVISVSSWSANASPASQVLIQPLVSSVCCQVA